MKRVVLFTVLIFSLLLTACGSGDPQQPQPPQPQPPQPPTGGGAISGFVTSPDNNPSGTGVVACLTTDEECTNGVGIAANADGTYTIPNVPAGSYIVGAAKDANGTGAFDAGDYVGVYTTDGQTAGVVTPPATDINIQMFVYQPGVNRFDNLEMFKHLMSGR